MESKLISIIIPTYNRSEILAHVSVPSVINQAYKNWELIIVDDGSTDNTKNVCEELTRKDARIKYFYKENGGQGSARNFGIEKAQGNYVLLLDSDDALLSEMISIMLPKLISEGGDIIKCRKWDFHYQKRIYNVGGDNPSCAIYHKKLFKTLGFYNENRGLIGIEDADLDMTWHLYKIKNSYQIKCIILDRSLVIYLNHDDQATSDKQLLRKKQMMQVLVDKYAGNSLICLGPMYGQLGNLKILLGDLSGRDDIKKSLNSKFNITAMTYLCLSYLGVGIYKFLLPILKTMCNNFLGKIKVLKMRLRCNKYFSEAVEISRSYEDWL
ncbi:MAG: glycosyltransferase family 2 protein [Patescibacteria group bacterium]